MAPGKNKDEWDDLEEAEKDTSGISPEIARALLNTNPALRQGGMNTDLLIKQRKGAAPATPEKKESRSEQSLADMAKTLEKRLQDAQTQLANEKKALLESLVQWLKLNDPELRSPFTQQVLEQKKALFSAIGFDVKAYVAARMKG
jgi:phosphoenolpyruvate-protein kinase (PTS system EI component)